MDTEEALVERILAGDPEAEAAFYRMYQPRLLRATMYFLGGYDSEAEDIVQNTFLIAFPKLKDYVFKAPMYAWLRQICLRLCYVRLRDRTRVLVCVDEDLEGHLKTRAVERLQQGESEGIRQGRLGLLRELKSRLSFDGQKIIELRDVQGLPYAEIGGLLGLPPGTVMSRLARARGQLRRWALDREGEPLKPA